MSEEENLLLSPPGEIPCDQKDTPGDFRSVCQKCVGFSRESGAGAVEGTSDPGFLKANCASRGESVHKVDRAGNAGSVSV